MTCEKCGDEVTVGAWPWCPHGTPSLSIVGDDIPGGMTIENMSATPETFYTKGAWKARMKQLGLINRVQHVPTRGSDKSPHTSRWI